MTSIATGLGLATQCNIEIQITMLALDSTTASIVADAGSVSITITGSAGGLYDGTYIVAIADLAGGPVNIIVPTISGTPGTGEVLTAAPGVWVYDGQATAPSVGYQWQRDGADIPGATTASYSTTAPDEGSDITCIETLSNSNGTRTQTTNAIAIPAAANDPVSQLAAALGAKLWAAYDLSDFANLTQNDDGTGAVTSAGDPVEWYADGTGNGRDLSTAGVTGGGNAIARAGYVESNNAGLKLASAPTGLSAIMEVYALIDLDGDTSGILVGDAADANTYAGVFNNGNTTQPLSGGFAGSPAFTVDGATSSPYNRDGMHDALDGGGYATLGGQGLDLQTVGQDMMIMAYYNNVAGFSFSGRIKLIAITDALDAGERTSLHSIFDGEK